MYLENKHRQNLQEKYEKESTLRVFRESDGNLSILVQGERVRVSIKPCFPWSHSGQFLSLVDQEGEEVGFVEKLTDLDKNSRENLQQALQEAEFCFFIKKVHSIKEDFELRTWSVSTENGDRKFQTKLMDFPRVLPGGVLLIQDLHGDLFCIKKPGELPEPGRKLLSAFID